MRVFNGPRSNFPSGVFASKEAAEKWVQEHRLSGTLTRYPVDVGTYDWAVSKGFFTPSRDDQRSPEFISKFSSASQEHYHFEDGKR